MMTQNFRRTAIAMASAAVLCLPALPSLAAITGHQELEQIVKSELRGLGIPDDRVSQLTLAQIAELASITESSDSAADRKTEAEAVIAKALDPQVIPMRKQGLVELEAILRNDLESVGITLPPREQLTLAQVSELTGIFDSANDPAADKEQAAKLVLGIN
jgi:hypothetical protein